MPTSASVLLLERAPRSPEGALRSSEKDVPTGDEGRLLLCVLCGHGVTTASARTARGGRQAHTFTNPHGFVFHIGCFATAPGCRATGEPTTEFTWFPGFAWQIAVCGGCGEHLGWLFRSASAEEAFSGLILDRLVERDGPGAR